MYTLVCYVAEEAKRKKIKTLSYDKYMGMLQTFLKELECLWDFFCEYDSENERRIGLHQLEQIMMEIEPDFDRRRLAKLFKRYGDGNRLNFSGFFNLMRNCEI